MDDAKHLERARYNASQEAWAAQVVPPAEQARAA